MTREDVYKTIDAVPVEARERNRYIYFKKSILNKLRMKTELTKKGFRVFGINDDLLPYDMVISGSNIFYKD